MNNFKSFSRMFTSGTTNSNSNNKTNNQQDSDKESQNIKDRGSNNSQKTILGMDSQEQRQHSNKSINRKIINSDMEAHSRNFHMAINNPDIQQAMQSVFGENLPALLKIDQKDKQQQVLIQKLVICSYTFDMSPNNKQFMDEKETKRQTLIELLDFVSSEQGIYSEEILSSFVTMVRSNLFRALPPSRFQNSNNFDAEEEEQLYLEPGWQHLTCVYELLLRLVVSSEIDIRMLKRYIDIDFISNLLELFDSEDPRERDILKTILHRIYGKFMQHRAYIRKAINHVFYRFVFETERHNGIGELLEILGSIINGFAVPVKEEHKYIEKEQGLTVLIATALMKYWPATNSLKELLFINELEDMLELIHQPVFEQIQIPVFKQLARCIVSTHFQVSERALILLNNDKILPRIMANRDVLFSILVPALLTNQWHWNGQVSENTKKLELTFHDQDKALYESCKQEYQDNCKKETEVIRQRSQKWEKIEKEASKNSFNKSSVSSLSDQNQENNVSAFNSEDDLGQLHSYKDKQNERQKQMFNQVENKKEYNDVAMQNNENSSEDSNLSSQTVHDQIDSVSSVNKNQQVTV